MYTIVIPLSPCGGFSQDDTELRYALRSLDTYFKDPFELVIVGNHLPGWVQNVTHLPCGSGLKTAIAAAADAYPEGFFWFYDDCCLLMDTTAEEMKVTPQCKTFNVASDTKWGKQLEEVRARLETEGYHPKDFSRPHGPYWFDKGMIDEAFADWPGMSGKFPFESWILSKRKWPGVYGASKHYYGSFDSPPGDKQRYVNYSDAGNTPKLREWLSAKLSRPSRFEPRGASVFFLNIAGTEGDSLLAAAGKHFATNSQWKPRPWSDDALQKSWRSTGSLPVTCAIMDPVSRAAASYLEISSRSYPECEPHYRVLREMFRCLSFSEFWERANVEALLPVIPHLMPQTTFIRNAPLDMILRHETMNEDLAELSARYSVDMASWTPVRHGSGEVEVSDAARRRILTTYASDVSFFYPHLKQK
jgi:hypothetical protein